MRPERIRLQMSQNGVPTVENLAFSAEDSTERGGRSEIVGNTKAFTQCALRVATTAADSPFSFDRLAVEGPQAC